MRFHARTHTCTLQCIMSIGLGAYVYIYMSTIIVIETHLHMDDFSIVILAILKSCSRTL